MEDIKDCHKITVLRMISTDALREKLDDQIYVKYEDAREELMRHANRKLAERRDQDVVMGGTHSLTTPPDPYEGKGPPLYDQFTGELSALGKGVENEGKG